METAKSYIQNQAEHHRKTTFQQEYIKFLENYQIDYDPKYVWDLIMVTLKPIVPLALIITSDLLYPEFCCASFGANTSFAFGKN